MCWASRELSWVAGLHIPQCTVTGTLPHRLFGMHPRHSWLTSADSLLGGGVGSVLPAGYAWVRVRGLEEGWME